MELVQGDESVAEYNAKFVKLYRFALPTVVGEEIVKKFERGLQPSYPGKNCPHSCWGTILKYLIWLSSLRVGQKKPGRSKSERLKLGRQTMDKESKINRDHIRGRGLQHPISQCRFNLQQSCVAIVGKIMDLLPVTESLERVLIVGSMDILWRIAPPFGSRSSWMQMPNSPRFKGEFMPFLSRMRRRPMGLS